jgi:steroid 5-alpha reductase family enzyme
MTLPALISLEECSDFAKTVEPFIPQLYELPKKLLDTVQTGGSLLDLYKTTNPLISGFALSIVLGAVFLVVAEINRNYSQVDRCWSLLPTIYIGHFDIWARLTGVPHQRIDIVLLFSTLWSVRRFNALTRCIRG